MRRRVAQVLAAATGVAILLLAVLFASVQHRRQAAARGEAAAEPGGGGETPAAALRRTDRGREVYRELNCGACHSIEGRGNRRSPLDGVGARLPPETIRRWIVDPRGIDPRVKKPDYDDLPEEDLEALVAHPAAPRCSTGPVSPSSRGG